MTKISVTGFPRFGIHRELKKATEEYFNGSRTRDDTAAVAEQVRKQNWELQARAGVDLIPSNDFSMYDTMLDTAYLLNAVPNRYSDTGLDETDLYFAMAKGHQKSGIDLKALEMKKWFNTNYHYIVPEIGADTSFTIRGNKIFTEFSGARDLGFTTKPVLPGPFTFLKLSKILSGSLHEYAGKIIPAYIDIFQRLSELGAEMIQLDEPVLATDLTTEDIALFSEMYRTLLAQKGPLQVLLQTYFGDVRDIYDTLMELPIDALGLDFIEGHRNLHLIQERGFPGSLHLVAGIVNGKNIWRNNYRISLETLTSLSSAIDKKRIIIGTSCSLLHVPYTVENETSMDERYRRHLSFAKEKLTELSNLKFLYNAENYESSDIFQENQLLMTEKAESPDFQNTEVRDKTASIRETHFARSEPFNTRRSKQKNNLNLPLLPSTTIGSFPQTADVRKIRSDYKKGLLTENEYNKKIREMIRNVIKLQEEIGLDVLVHGEYERNDMVEYFGENLKGFIFTENGWVQSYGTRGVKPPVIFGDVRRTKPITVEWIQYAQSLTRKPVKGMLTGPVTILNWSFPREDLPLKEIAFQIALAIQEEVADLENAGIQIIQIDEAALREKLPLRKEYRGKDYLDWAILAFRLATSQVKPETQIHTHMCYSEFSDIMDSIKAMDADVITIEAARSDLSILDSLKAHNYDKEIGPGVYDIHSPRIPDENEISEILETMISKLDPSYLWVNPDCGLKTRSMAETVPSLKNMVNAAKKMRE